MQVMSWTRVRGGQRFRRIMGLSAVLVMLAGLGGYSGSSAAPTPETEYVVVYADGVSTATAQAAVRAAGGTIVAENSKLGVATVRSSAADFMTNVSKSTSLVGAARNTPIGYVPTNARPAREEVERMQAERDRLKGTVSSTATARAAAPADAEAEPLADLQWGMQMIGATMDGSYAVERGDRRVLVGVMDTGIDGNHPDLRANFNRDLSRNFVTDIPSIDGPCESITCQDPVDVDHDGHGTHVAGIIGAAINGFGVSGVAPEVSLVNIRTGQDSGYFFLQPTVEALTYAGDIGIDVVNMSYYIDPWLYNCYDNPADSPEAQMEQRTIITATQRAARYARNRGVTLISTTGNNHTDLGNPLFDDSSPDFPPGSAYDRHVDNSCLKLPTETKGVIAVSGLGPSERLAYYSDYGLEQTDISAPGGDYYDDAFAGAAGPANMILSTYPEYLARLNGELNEDGTPNTPFVVRDCDMSQNGQCAYYQYLQGTSMAAPHVTGVAALIVSAFGRTTPDGLGMAPGAVGVQLFSSAVDHACPRPRMYVYDPPIPSSYSAYCEGSARKNGFYGNGILNAARAVAQPN